MQGSSGKLADYRIREGVAILAIDHPPVNALSHVVRIALMDGVQRALDDPHADALVIICRGRTFFAGADVKELGRPIEPPLLADIMRSFEASSKPIVSAMHGTALGGGFELALAGHFRVGVPSLLVGLPEVALGVLPGAGGTQRLPRLVGAEKGLELIGLGRHIGASEALELGMLDAVVDERDLEAAAAAFARKIVAEARPLKRVRDIRMACDRQEFDACAERFRQDNPHLFVGLKAPQAAIEAVRAAAFLPFDEGIARERELSSALRESPESAAQRHLFFAERAAAKWPDASVKASAPASLRVSGAWEAADRFQDLMVVDGEAVLVVADDEDFDTYAARLSAFTDAPVVVATRHLDRFQDLREHAVRAGRLVGLNQAFGVWEIVVDESSDPVAGATIMQLARVAGVPAIYTRPRPGLVLKRLYEAFAGSVAALRAQGAPDADIAASAAAYGFAARMTRMAATDGCVREELGRRLVADCAHEAMDMIAQGVVLRGSDIDFAMVKAGLWPLWRGGPAFVAEREGAERIAQWRAPVRAKIE